MDRILNIRIGRAVAAGLIGTAAMTVVGLWVAPLMGMPLFSGSVVIAMGSLVGHMVYGAIVGDVYGPVEDRVGTRAAAAAAV